MAKVSFPMQTWPIAATHEYIMCRFTTAAAYEPPCYTPKLSAESDPRLVRDEKTMLESAIWPTSADFDVRRQV